MIDHSPAEILMKHLIANGIVFPVSVPVVAWQAYLNGFPDTPDKIVGFNDTTGEKDGRLMLGPTIFHPGIQIRTRSEANGQRTGFKKMSEISAFIDSIKMVTVTFTGPTKSYKIHACRHTTPVIPIGVEQGNLRFLHSLNLLITITEI